MPNAINMNYPVAYSPNTGLLLVVPTFNLAFDETAAAAGDPTMLQDGYWMYDPSYPPTVPAILSSP